MKKFTLLAIAALLSVVAFAQKPKQVLRNLVPFSTQLTQVQAHRTISATEAQVLLAKQSKTRRAPAKVEADPDFATVTLTAGDVWGDGSGYQLLLDADATAYAAVSNNGLAAVSYDEYEYKIPENADYSTETSNVVFENSVTIKIPAGTYDYIITNPSPSDKVYIAGGGKGDDYVFEKGHVYEFSVARSGSGDNVTIAIDGEEIVPETPSVVELPEGAELVEYALTYTNYSGNAASGTAAVAVVGDEVYFKGFSSYIPDALIKGTKVGNTITFPSGQYLGSYAGYDSYLTQGGVFTYDAATDTYSAEGDVYSLLDNYYIDVYATNPVLKGVVEKAATPAAPAITALTNGNYGYYITFNVPNVDTNGDALVSSKLSFIIYTDVEKEVSPLTFTPATHVYLEENLTEIPFGFSENYDFYATQIYLNELYSADWNKIGIKSIYRGGGETHETEIQWYTIKPYALEQAQIDLATEIETAEALVASDSYAVGKDALSAAIEAAKTVQDNADATVDELNEAVSNLQAAVSSFRILNTNYSKLSDEIATAEALVDAEGKPEGLANFQTAIAAAKAVLSNEDATTADYQAAVEALQQAEADYKAANGAGEAQWVARDQDYTNAQVIESFTIDENIAATVAKGEGSTAPAYYNTGNALRLYGGNTLTISGGAKVENISKIVLTTATGNYSGSTITADNGTYTFSGTKGTWEGESTAVTFTRPGTSGHARIQTIDVYYTVAVNPDEPSGTFNYEKIAITPAEGQVESLESFVISFGGQEVTVNEDALPNLTKTGTDDVVAEAGIALNADGTVSVDLSDRVSADGNYTLNIPENAIFFNGTSLDPLSFKYTIGTPAEYTIDPAEGEVESLSTFTITFNNYMVEETDEAAAILFNTETEAEVEGYVYAIGGGKAAYISLAQEVTTPGTYQLIILDGSLKKTIDDSFLPELAFDYTIVGGGEPVQEDVLVEVPATATVEEWTLEGTYTTNSGGTAQQIATEVAFDGNDIYVKGLAYYFEESWIKGTINGSTATFPTGQFVGEDDYGKEYLLGYDGEEITDIQFAYDAEAKTLTLETNYILENGDSREELSIWGYWRGVVLYAGAPEVLDPVEAPADLATETYLFKSQAIEYDEDTEENSLVDYEIQVQVGFDGDDLYIQGLSADAPELWVKATKNDNGQYVIPANQYMGQLSLWGGYYVFDYFFTATDGTSALLDVVLNYDADTQTLSTDQWLALNGSKNTLYYYLLFNGATITKINEVAATPADPEVVAINFTGTYPNAQFNVPATGTEGEALLTNKLFYTIWIEKDDVQQPYTFTAELYNQDFEEDVTEVPYSHEGWDFYAGAERVYFEEILDELETWSKIGIQSIYYGADERRVSNVVWAENPNFTTGISNINVNDNDATFFDLQGRTASKTQKGLLIMKAADGKTIKVVRK